MRECQEFWLVHVVSSRDEQALLSKCPCQALYREAAFILRRGNLLEQKGVFQDLIVDFRGLLFASASPIMKSVAERNASATHVAICDTGMGGRHCRRIRSSTLASISSQMKPFRVVSFHNPSSGRGPGARPSASREGRTRCPNRSQPTNSPLRRRRPKLQAPLPAGSRGALCGRAGDGQHRHPDQCLRPCSRHRRQSRFRSARCPGGFAAGRALE